jgi:sporulation protein YlmC with PRC-barrel domain
VISIASPLITRIALCVVSDQSGDRTIEEETRMLRSLNNLIGSAILATDGEIGDVEEFYFDDEQWAVRDIVINTGSWLSGRQSMISPFSVRKVDRDNRKLHVNLTKTQLENSPNVDTQKPVSREVEAAHLDYYGFPYYWGGPFLWGAGEYPDLTTQQSAWATAPMANSTTAHTTPFGPAAAVLAASANTHLRSTQEVSSYHIAATDGEIGHVDDFIIDEDSWTIRYIAIDTRNWLPGKKVLVSPRWISSIDWAQSKVHVNLSREGVKQSPEYDSSKSISYDYETLLHRHYGQPGYWLN